MNNGSVAPFMDEVMATSPVLSRDEQVELIGKAQAGDKKAMDKLIRHNMRFVRMLARKYVTNTIFLDDLLQDGLMGLHHSILKFDKSRKCALSTYSSWWIEAFIRKSAEKTGLVKKMERNGNQVKYKVLKNGDMVSMSEVRDGEYSLEETLADTRPLADETYLDKQLTEKIRRSVHAAAKAVRETKIAERFMSDERITLEQIGQETGVCRERIRQIEKQMKQRLRARPELLKLRKELA